MQLYRWNARAGQSLYWSLQMVEVATRNGISRVLVDKFGDDWHMSAKFRRILAVTDQGKLDDAVNRQVRQRGVHPPAVDALIADISFGFWSALLTRRYEVPLGWASRLTLAFPFLPGGAARETVSRPLDDARDLRNRISHHEPLIGMRLSVKYRELLDVLGWICPETRWYVEQHCDFVEVWDSHPATHLRRS